MSFIECYNGQIYFVDAAAGQIKSSVRGYSSAVSSLAFKPDDPNILVTGGRVCACVYRQQVRIN